MFGFLEGTRYIVATASLYAATAIFSAFASDVAGFMGAILFFSIGIIVASILVLFIYPNNANPHLTSPSGGGREGVAPAVEEKKEPAKRISLKLYLEVARYPHVWLCGLIVFFNYLAISLMNYMNLYFTSVFGISQALASTLVTTSGMISMVLGAYLGGLMADKVGSRSKFMMFAFIGMAVFFFLVLIIPGSKTWLWPFFVVLVISGFAAYCIKGIYFATLGDVKIPKYLVGAASGIVSLIGYMPDMFIYSVAGNIVTAYQKAGNPQGAYPIIFAIMVGTSVLGIAACAVLQHIIKVKNINTVLDNDAGKEAEVRAAKA
jgi:predicted MFS family arabinose efflux permease